MEPSDRAEGLLVVLTTVPDEAKGAEIARALVGEKLAACVNVVPGLRSIYRWEGKIEDDREALLVAKVPSARFAAYAARVAALHPYQVPEVVALRAEAVSESYLRWCLAEARP